MPNIKFSYFYRDSSNYKKYNSIIFENQNNFDLAFLDKQIQSNLIDNTWFYAEDWGLPSLFFDNFNPLVDPTWHEFETIELTDSSSDKDYNLINFIKKLKQIV